MTTPPKPQAVVAGNPDLPLVQLYRATADARAELLKSKNDILTIGEVIQQAGRDAGVTVHIGGAATGLANGGGQHSSTQLDSTSLIIDAEGTLAHLAHLVAFLETLPVPSVLEQFQLSRTGESKVSAWRISARVKVFYSPDDIQ